MRKITRTALLAMSVTLALAGMSYAQVVEKIPADALVVVKVANLAQTSAKVAKLAETLGVNAFLPMLNDPLAELKKKLKITGGLKDDGELAFVYMDPKGGEEGKSMIILVPVTDYAALVGNIEGATTDGDLTVTKGQDGQDVYIANWNGYAAASPMKALVATAPTTMLKLPARAAKELGGNDVSLFANFAALREPLMADLAKNKDKAKQQMLDDMKAKGQVPEKYFPVASAAFDQVFGVLESFIRDSDAATIGLNIGENGIHENIVTEFKEGSYLGKMAAGLKDDSGTHLASLPLGKYLVYGGSSIPGDLVGQLIDDIGGPIIKALPADEDMKIVPEYIDSMKKMLTEMKSTSFGLVAPQGAIGQEAVVQYLAVIKGDGAKITSQMKEMNEKYSTIVSKVMADAQGVGMKQEYLAGGKVIDGVSFDQISTEFVGDSAMANQQRQMMQVMYGQPKVDLYLGSTGDAVLGYISANEDSVKALIAATKAKTSPLADTDPVKAVAKELPANRVAEFYVQVDEIAAFALRVANQFGFVQGNIQLPPDLQPVGLSFSSEGNSLEFNYYVSTDLLQALVSGGLQASQLMQGGGGKAGGGL